MNKEKIREIIETCEKQNTCELDIRYDEPMDTHTTFKVGGPADCWIRPAVKGFESFVSSLLCRSYEESVPVFILGGGANIVVSDKGIRGIVLDTGAWKGEYEKEGRLFFRSGTSMDEAADYAASRRLSGLEFLAGMPGTLGGAVYMNARCYNCEIADVIAEAEIFDFSVESGGVTKSVHRDKMSFAYKTSPFQNRENLILSASFNLKDGDGGEIKEKMAGYRKDRKDKGHYLFPCAGSAFKNNRDFGRPTGQIIDELGLKGFAVGGAQVAPYHGNIIINKTGASASDIRALADEVAKRVEERDGFILEPEILFIGEW
jgi:UDP-N-acetylmuramate dehydrogenase